MPIPIYYVTDLCSNCLFSSGILFVLYFRSHFNQLCYFVVVEIHHLHQHKLSKKTYVLLKVFVGVFLLRSQDNTFSDNLD